MATPGRYADIVDQLVSSSTFPSAADLEDHNCSICYRGFLEHLDASEGEIPIKLRCGHVLGLSCLLRWAFQQVEQLPNNSHLCPICRRLLVENEQSSGTVLGQSGQERDVDEFADLFPDVTSGGDESGTELRDANYERDAIDFLDWFNSSIQGGDESNTVRNTVRTAADEERDTNRFLGQLTSWVPGGGEGLEVSTITDTWIRRAEDLWSNLCDEILNDLDRHDFSDGVAVAMEDFLCNRIPIAEELVSFGSAVDFYQAFVRGTQWRPDSMYRIDETFPSYQPLIDHLNIGNRGTFDQRAWRIRQTFRGSHDQLDGYRLRMERSKALLIERVADIRGTEA
ncbi:MAG: hypothetical protein Q9168_003477 [Polycauliona sp. 1 TL-2023]